MIDITKVKRFIFTKLENMTEKEKEELFTKITLKELDDMMSETDTEKNKENLYRLLSVFGLSVEDMKENGYLLETIKHSWYKWE